MGADAKQRLRDIERKVDFERCESAADPQRAHPPANAPAHRIVGRTRDRPIVLTRRSA
jgi:hypothetical protein